MLRRLTASNGPMEPKFVSAPRCGCAKVRAALVLDSDVIWGLQRYPDPHQEA